MRVLPLFFVRSGILLKKRRGCAVSYFISAAGRAARFLILCLCWRLPVRGLVAVLVVTNFCEWCKFLFYEKFFLENALTQGAKSGIL